MRLGEGEGDGVLRGGGWQWGWQRDGDRDGRKQCWRFGATVGALNNDEDQNIDDL